MELERGDYEKIRDSAKNQGRDAVLNLQVNNLILEWAEKKLKEFPEEEKE